MLPVFIRNTYGFYLMRILDTPCLLTEIMDEAPGVDVIKKHIKRIEEITKLNVVFYYKDITRYRRKSLIKNQNEQKNSSQCGYKKSKIKKFP